jgi:hypothetical protein
MTDRATNALAQLHRESAETLALAGSYARTLESLARRMQSVVVGPHADSVALRSTGLRLSHTAKEAIATLLSLIVQSARLDILATMHSILELKAESSNQ